MARLVKRREICRMLGISPSKVNFYTKQDLFPLAGQTPGGYGLYDAELIERRFHRIAELKEERLTIREIRDRILEEEKTRKQFLELRFDD